MEYVTKKEVAMHKSLVEHIMTRNIRHSQEDPKTEDVLAVYNTWPGRGMCNTTAEADWCFKFIRRVFMTNERLWREALQIDGFIV